MRRHNRASAWTMAMGIAVMTAGAVLLSAGAAARAAEQIIDPQDIAADAHWPLYDDPDLGEIPIVPTFDPRLKELWLAGLARADADTRRRAVADIGEAHQRGMAGLADTAAVIVRLIDDPDQHPLFILAAAKALIQLDAKQAAASLLGHNRRGGESGVIRGSPVRSGDPKALPHGGIELVLLTDPALAAWDHEPARKLWLSRLSDPATPRAVRVSAIGALGRVGESGAAGALRRIATDQAHPDAALRLAAAEALANIARRGAAADADELADGAMADRLIAATLLKYHSREDAAVGVLRKLAADAEPAVAALAAQKLLSFDAALLDPLAQQKLIDGADPQVRLIAAQAIIALGRPDELRPLAAQLNDASPQVRHYVRRQFIRLGGDPALNTLVHQEAMRIVAGDQWRGVEQAAIILGRLDHEPAAPRLLELLTYPRDEVKLAAIVALRRLAAPDTLAPVLAHATRETERWHKVMDAVRADETRPYRIDNAFDKQLAQMFQFFGVMRYAPADPLLRRYIPKDSGYWIEARSAAIWALGCIHEDKPDGALARLLVGRLSDIDPTNPEMTGVRRASAIALGRMKAADAATLGALRRFHEDERASIHIGGSCRWALIQITGQSLPPLPPRQVSQTDWFLNPIKPRE